MKLISAILLTLSSTIVLAAPPKVNNVLSIELGTPAAQVEEQLKQLYPGCNYKKINFPNEEGRTADSLNLIHLTMDECMREDAEFVDIVDAEFIETEFDEKQPLIGLTVYRLYTEPEFTIKYSYEDVKKQIFDKYGEPSARAYVTAKGKVLKTKTIPSKTLNISEKYVWGENVTDPTTFCMMNMCGRYHLTVNMDISKKPALSKNQFYVKNVVFKLGDDMAWDKRVERNMALNEAKKQKGLSF